jgi:hypothetical protein
MKARASIIPAIIACVLTPSCSASSGVEASKQIRTLMGSDYERVCKFTNDKLQAFVGSTCNNFKISGVLVVPCESNPTTNDPNCKSTVGDLEACLNSLTPCALQGGSYLPEGCYAPLNCFGLVSMKK